MRKPSISFLLIILAVYSSLSAQSKLLSLEDAVTRGNGALTPKKIQQLYWIPGSHSFTYIEKTNGKESLVKRDAGTEKSETLLTIDELNAQLNIYHKPVKRFPLIQWENKQVFHFLNGDSIYSYNIVGKNLSLSNTIDTGAENQEFENNGSRVAFTKGNNLFVSTGIGQIKQVSFDTHPDIVNGQSVHRNEFGINKGIFWSPSGQYLAYYRMDQTMVTDYPLVDITERPAKLVNTKYPMAGMTSHQVTIGIYNLNSGKTIWLNSGEPKDQYLSNVTWSPDEKYIFVAHLNRDQNHMQLIKYDALTGEKIKMLFEEKNNKYVEPLNGPVFLKTKNLFIWQSRRDGWNHLYLYDTDGRLIKQVTKGQWEITDFEGLDTQEKNVFIVSTKDDVLQRHLYKVNLSSGELTKLTKEEGTHQVKLNSTGEFFIDSYSSLSVPSAYSIADVNGKVVNTIFTPDNPLKDYKLGSTRLFSINSNDGQKLYCRIILPFDFDSTKKYPVLVYVYGGPHSQLVTNTWLGGGSLWFNYMAQQGYIVFTLDNRGTANRGQEFEQATFRHLGTKEIEDQVSGVNYLKTLSYVDEKRIGVFGWSYGGFMTVSLMTRTTGIFKVGVAGGPVIDWSYYEIMYGERYMDTPQANPEGYQESSLLNYVSNLRGKLLLVHGTIDPTVVWQNSLMFVEKAVSLGVPLDYFPYPGHEHGVVGSDQLHLYRKITGYVKENL